MTVASDALMVVLYLSKGVQKSNELFTEYRTSIDHDS